jgi:hypothetical protein
MSAVKVEMIAELEQHLQPSRCFTSHADLEAGRRWKMGGGNR